MSKPDFIQVSPPGLISTDAIDDHGDVIYLTIDEWKKAYGTPGDPRPDSQGRVWGFFPTEPEFCEEAA